MFIANPLFSQSPKNEKTDTLQIPGKEAKHEIFYDSLKSVANKKRFTKLIHSWIIKDGSRKKIAVDTTDIHDDIVGKTVGKIDIVRLDVFGPSIRDTARVAKSWIERAGNKIHTTSDLHNLRKNLIIKPGDTISKGILYENERIFRTLDRIRDVRFVAVPDSANNKIVNLVLITQDRFSIGVSGQLYGTHGGRAEIYNRNFFGVGHEVSAAFVGHTEQKPHYGLEASYRINNINGKFLNFSFDYMHSFRNEGAVVALEKPFITKTDRWGFGVNGYHYNRTRNLPNSIVVSEDPFLKFNQIDIWGGRNFQLGKPNENNSQLTLAAHYTLRHFTRRPVPDLPMHPEQFFANSNLYLLGLIWSKKNYVRGQLIYGYGVTEDIPIGFKNELVFGFDDNENGHRYYSHLYLSKGDFLFKKYGYYDVYAGAGGFFNKNKFEQGQIEAGLKYISHLYYIGNLQFRNFSSIDYMKGFNRFDIENLYFERNNLIRGFSSKRILGKERLSTTFEMVYFHKKQIYRFNVALYGFLDMGVIGNGNKLIFAENYFTGIGIGLRLHNESLVLKTLSIRFAFYPYSPKDVSSVGFLLTEQTRSNFPNYQPEPPNPLSFQ